MHVRKPPDFIEPAAGRTELTSGRGPSHPLRSLGAVDNPPRRLTFRSPMERLRLVPLDDTVVFPSMTVTLPVDVGNDDRVFLVPRHAGDYAPVGVVAEVVDRVRLPGGGRALVLSGLHRGVAGAARNDPAGHLRRERLAELQVRKRIRDDAESGAQKQQRDYILRRQLDSIRKELGEDETSVADEYRKKIADAGMPDAVRKQAERELGRLER